MWKANSRDANVVCVVSKRGSEELLEVSWRDWISDRSAGVAAGGKGGEGLRREDNQSY